MNNNVERALDAVNNLSGPTPFFFSIQTHSLISEDLWNKMHLNKQIHMLCILLIEIEQHKKAR